MTASPIGASLDTRVPAPAIDLAALIEFLAPAVPLVSDEQAPLSWPLITWSPADRMLGINTLAPLWRFRADVSARKRLEQGFIVNAPVPKSAERAHLGGQIAPESEQRLRTAMDRLTRAIDAELDAAVADGFDPASLGTAEATELLDRLADQLGIARGDRLQGPTRIARTRITAVGSTRQARQDEVARYLAAIEEIDGTRDVHVAHFVDALQTLLQQQDYPERTIQGALVHHRAQAGTSGTQLARFFDFLGDEALSRVRLGVGNRMMESIADIAQERQQANPDRGLRLLVSYIRRSTELIDILSTSGLEMNLSASAYGKQSDFDLRSQVTTASFVNCLPVWPQAHVQMFEEKHDPTSMSGGDVTRELTYRFRVNGAMPDAPWSSAYENRLRRMEESWLRLDQARDGEPPQRVARSLAEVVFLWAIIPTDEDSPASGEDGFRCAQALVNRLENAVECRAELVLVLAELRQRVSIVDEITRALIQLMQARGTVVTRSALGRRWTYHINVLREIVDLARAAEKVDRPLQCSPSPAQEQIDFFKYIRVTPDHSFPRALLSIQVNVSLSEYSLQLTAEHENIALSRRQPEHLAQVVWRPYISNLKADPATWTPALKTDLAWLAPGRVEVQFYAASLRWPKGKSTTPEGLQLVAATRAAFAVLVYVTLLRLFQRAMPDVAKRHPITMLRLQQEGADAARFSGDEGIYAAAQAIEMLLGRDFDIRMQGVVLDGSTSDAHGSFKRKGAYAALFAGFPLRIAQTEGDRPTIGVISFAARPCNDHPDHPEVLGNRLVLARSYVSSPTDLPFRGYEVHCATTCTEIIEDPDLPLPATVEREIERLHVQDGCNHIIVLEHRFGQRRTGNQAARTRLRRQDALLTHLTTHYPDITIYPLVRDAFSATRVRARRIGTEDAFEILRPGEHFDALTDASRLLRHAYTPVYSLATLHIVGGADAQIERPQSGFCTYFLLRDDLAPIDAVEQMRSNLLAPASSVRESLIGALRSIHYLEAERAIGPNAVQPVLDPYDWMAPLNVGKVGEVLVFDRSRSSHGTVSLSLTAILDIVSSIVHAQRRVGTPR